MAISSLIKELALDGILLAAKRKQIKKSAKGYAFSALSCVLALVGLLFLIDSCFLLFKEHFPPEEAALFMALILLALAMVLSMLAHAIKKKRRREAFLLEDAGMLALANSVFDMAQHHAASPVRKNPKMALLFAGIAGLFAKNFIR